MLRLMATTTAHALFGVSDGGWSAIAAWVGLSLAAAAAIYARSQFQEARRTRDEQAQPYVAIFMEPTEADPNAADLIIKNFGATAARDIRIKIDPPPQSTVDGVKVPNTIHTLVPGQEWSTFWDTLLRRKDTELPSHHTATITFKDSRDRQLGPYMFDLDWNQILDRGWIVTHGMHELAGAIREIRDEYKHRGDSQFSHVLMFDGDERERWEQAVKEQQETLEQQPPHPGGAG
jgi:hypothetical protein